LAMEGEVACAAPRWGERGSRGDPLGVDDGELDGLRTRAIRDLLGVSAMVSGMLLIGTPGFAGRSEVVASTADEVSGAAILSILSFLLRALCSFDSWLSRFCNRRSGPYHSVSKTSKDRESWTYGLELALPGGSP
jgi:hypothetical protein